MVRMSGSSNVSVSTRTGKRRVSGPEATGRGLQPSRTFQTARLPLADRVGAPQVDFERLVLSAGCLERLLRRFHGLLRLPHGLPRTW